MELNFEEVIWDNAEFARVIFQFRPKKRKYRVEFFLNDQWHFCDSLSCFSEAMLIANNANEIIIDLMTNNKRSLSPGTTLLTGI